MMPMMMTNSPTTKRANKLRTKLPITKFVKSPEESDEGDNPVIKLGIVGLGVVGLGVVELIVVGMVGLVDIVDEEQGH
jgi:hypothetical protein